MSFNGNKLCECFSVGILIQFVLKFHWEETLGISMVSISTSIIRFSNGNCSFCSLYSVLEDFHWEYPFDLLIRISIVSHQVNLDNLMCMMFFLCLLKEIIHCASISFVKNLILEFHCMDFNHRTGMNN